MRGTLANFQPLLSWFGKYQLSNSFKKGERLYWSVTQAKTSTAHVDGVINEVVEEVAEAEDVDPLELTPPLYEVIDPGALDQIFASTPTTGGREGQVAFSYNGYEVTVSGDGHVSVQ